MDNDQHIQQLQSSLDDARKVIESADALVAEIEQELHRIEARDERIRQLDTEVTTSANNLDKATIQLIQKTQ